MSRKRYIPALALGLAMAFSLPSAAQTERPLTWQDDLNYLAQASVNSAEVRSTLTNIRSEIASWANLHPDAKLSIPAELDPSAGPAQLQAQVKQLQAAVETIITKDPNRPFHLGSVAVNVVAPISELSPIADSIDQKEMQKRNELNVATALESMPGVSLNPSYSGRYQVMASVHGFSALQVPLMIDGIPVNDPYDGTLDFRQFSTGSVSEVQVAKGFSSPLIGPNAVGGAINIVTKQPEQKLEGDLLIGGFAGDGLVSGAHAGSRMNHFFLQAGMDWMQQSYIPLSGNFVRTATIQPTDQLNHSDLQTARYSGRIGWTPKGDDQYVFSYIHQRATSGIPLTPGNDPVAQSSCAGLNVPYSTSSSSCLGSSAYRKWAWWEKNSYYFHSNTALGAKSTLKTRVFYDTYPNLMLFYSDASYKTLKSGWNSTYDDHSDGFSTIFETRLVPRNTISGSFFFKDDTHKEPAYPTTTTPFPAQRAQTTSIGVQDVIRLTSQLQATVGFSADHINGLHASNSKGTAWVAPYCSTNTSTTNYTACTPHIWAYNPQVAASYTFHDSSRLFAGFAEKTRFAGMKEMYSAKMGTALPNPNLKSEKSFNYVGGYSRTFPGQTVAQVSYFFSELQNAIESLTITDANYLTDCASTKTAGFCTQTENATKERHQGIELTVRSTPVRRFTIDANYTYTNKQIDGYSFQGTQISNYPCGGGYMAYGTGTATLSEKANNSCLTATSLPKHMAMLAGTLSLPYDLSATAVLRYQGGNKQVDSFTTAWTGATDSTMTNGTSYSFYDVVRMSNYATFDLSAQAKMAKNTTIQAGVKNLLDRNYFYVLEFPEEGRNWFANVRYQF